VEKTEVFVFKHIYTFLVSCDIEVFGFRQGQLKIKGEEIQSPKFEKGSNKGHRNTKAHFAL